MPCLGVSRESLEMSTIRKPCTEASALLFPLLACKYGSLCFSAKRACPCVNVRWDWRLSETAKEAPWFGMMTLEEETGQSPQWRKGREQLCEVVSLLVDVLALSALREGRAMHCRCPMISLGTGLTTQCISLQTWLETVVFTAIYTRAAIHLSQCVTVGSLQGRLRMPE